MPNPSLAAAARKAECWSASNGLKRLEGSGRVHGSRLLRPVCPFALERVVACADDRGGGCPVLSPGTRVDGSGGICGGSVDDRRVLLLVVLLFLAVHGLQNGTRFGCGLASRIARMLLLTVSDER
jgi:hypothetical protein